MSELPEWLRTIRGATLLGVAWAALITLGNPTERRRFIYYARMLGGGGAAAGAAVVITNAATDWTMSKVAFWR